jgi:predicted GH43/DUF377 family glycosyl hydrolase
VEDLRAEIAEPSLLAIKSVVLQSRDNGWSADFFNFGLAARRGVDYFNPGLVERPDGLWLIARRSKWKSGLAFGMNDLVAFLLNGKHPVRGVPIRMEQRWPDEQWEDPRAIFHNGKTYVSCCNFIWTNQGWTGAHQIISDVSMDWGSVRRYDPIYGDNGENIGKNAHHEKNWLFWFHNGLPHMIYRGFPHTVVRFDTEFRFLKSWVTVNDTGWRYGEIRGGTPPVLVDGEYWTFFHSSTPWHRPKRQYHLGAYAFSAAPPFHLTRITEFPLLSGSPDDGGVPSKPPCIFACGSRIVNNLWTVTCGVNDLRCLWVDIPHADILDRTEAVC